jgi:monofunctional biosynthetic peptidoglycan transglycosylase
VKRSIWVGQAVRMLALVALCAAALQVVFVARIACMAWLAPQSTAFQRSEAWRLLWQEHRILWRQEWVDGERVATHLKRAVIASEDAGFAAHAGIEWDAVQDAWDRNLRAQARAERRAQRPGARPAQARMVGGSTITQQLAKNLFLSGERTVLRKAQELVLSLLLEGMLSKQRILEIYLNEVEWGEGVFGAQAASRHYFRVDAARLTPEQAARLAVMLPAPKRFEKSPAPAYVTGRAATIMARMGAVELP